MVDTAFLRSDELPGRAARATWPSTAPGPTCSTSRWSGAATAAPTRPPPTCTAFWDALHAGRVVPPDALAEMVRPHSDWPEENSRYGLGFHLHATGDAAWLEGYDAGVSFASVNRPSSSTTYTVIANWTDGAWPIIRAIGERIDG